MSNHATVPAQHVLDALPNEPDTRIRAAVIFSRFAGLWPHEMAPMHTDDLALGVLRVEGRTGARGLAADSQVVELFSQSAGWLFASARYSTIDHMTAHSITELVRPFLQAQGWTLRGLRNLYVEQHTTKRRDMLPPIVSSALAESYLSELRALGYSAGTLRLRRWQLASWERHLAGKPVGDANRDDVISYLNTCPPSISARRSRLGALTLFYAWGRLCGHFTAEPLLGLRKPKARRGVPQPIPDDLFHAALDAADPQLHDMLILARFAGLRCVEIASAHTRDLNDGVLQVAGKGGHRDAIPAHPLIVSVYDRPVSGWLFPSHSPRRTSPHLTAAAVSHLINAHLAIHAPGWTAHKLRHAFGSELYRASHDLLVTQKAMRHASPVTTAGYAQLDDERLRQVMYSLRADRAS